MVPYQPCDRPSLPIIGRIVDCDQVGLRWQSEEQFHYRPVFTQRQLKRPGWQKIPRNVPSK